MFLNIVSAVTMCAICSSGSNMIPNNAQQGRRIVGGFLPEMILKKHNDVYSEDRFPNFP